MDNAATLIRKAEEKYPETLRSGSVGNYQFPAANITQATAEELKTIIVLIDDDGFPEGSVITSMMNGMVRWAAGEDVQPLSAAHLINWLLLRRAGARKRGVL